MTIDGAAVPAAGHFDVVNPATGQTFTQAPDCTSDQLDAAMYAAARALPDWGLDDKRRRQALHDAADALEAGAARLAWLVTAEQGKPLGEAHDEVMASAIWLRHYAELELPHEV